MSSISEKQLIANKNNAQLGGVKTKAGKEVSKYNARKHSVLTEALSSYEQAKANLIIEDLREYFKPEGCIEELLVSRIAIWQVRLERSIRAETEKVKQVREPTIIEDHFKLELQTVVQEGYKPTIDDIDVQTLYQTYLRYDITIERNLMKTISNLIAFQANRKNQGK